MISMSAFAIAYVSELNSWPKHQIRIAAYLLKPFGQTAQHLADSHRHIVRMTSSTLSASGRSENSSSNHWVNSSGSFLGKKYRAACAESFSLYLAAEKAPKVASYFSGCTLLSSIKSAISGRLTEYFSDCFL